MGSMKLQFFNGPADRAGRHDIHDRGRTELTRIVDELLGDRLPQNYKMSVTNPHGSRTPEPDDNRYRLRLFASVAGLNFEESSKPMNLRDIGRASGLDLSRMCKDIYRARNQSVWGSMTGTFSWESAEGVSYPAVSIQLYDEAMATVIGGNDIFIHFDPWHDKTSGSEELVKLVLEKCFIACELLEGELEGYDTNNNVILTKLLVTTHEATRAKLETEIGSAIKDVDRRWTSYVTAEMKMVDRQDKLVSLPQAEEVEKFTADNIHKLIEAKFTIQAPTGRDLPRAIGRNQNDQAFIIQTPPVTIIIEDTELNYGPVLIYFYYGLSTRPYYLGGNRTLLRHPHIGVGLSSFGESEPRIVRAQHEGDIAASVGMMYNRLCTYDEGIALRGDLAEYRRYISNLS